jgi:hypothetical protein
MPQFAKQADVEEAKATVKDWNSKVEAKMTTGMSRQNAIRAVVKASAEEHDAYCQAATLIHGVNAKMIRVTG